MADTVRSSPMNECGSRERARRIALSASRDYALEARRRTLAPLSRTRSRARSDSSTSLGRPLSDLSPHRSLRRTSSSGWLFGTNSAFQAYLGRERRGGVSMGLRPYRWTGIQVVAVWAATAAACTGPTTSESDRSLPAARSATATSPQASVSPIDSRVPVLVGDPIDVASLRSDPLLHGGRHLHGGRRRHRAHPSHPEGGPRVRPGVGARW